MLKVLLFKLKALRDDRRGSPAIEFAILAPLLFTLTFGVIEYGFVFFGYSAIQQGANDVARRIAVNALDISQAQTAVNGDLPSWLGGVSVTARRTNPSDPTRSAVEVTAAMPAANTTPIHAFTTVFPWTLTSTVAVNQELPFSSN